MEHHAAWRKDDHKGFEAVTHLVIHEVIPNVDKVLVNPQKLHEAWIHWLVGELVEQQIQHLHAMEGLFDSSIKNITCMVGALTYQD